MNELGKNIGDDLAEGKPTLPLIHALKHGSPTQQALIREAIVESNGLQHFDAIMAAMHDTNAFGYTRNLAEREAELAKQAIEFLPPSPYKNALLTLADIAVERSH